MTYDTHAQFLLFYGEGLPSWMFLSGGRLTTFLDSVLNVALKLQPNEGKLVSAQQQHKHARMSDRAHWQTGRRPLAQILKDAEHTITD